MMNDNQALNLDALPAEWDLVGAELTPIGLGCSQAGVWHVFWSEGETTRDAYLKIQDRIAGESLGYDRDVLNWLKGRAPVPEIFGYHEDAEREYLLMQALPGEPMSEDYFLEQPEQTVRLLAESLKLLHSIAVDDCPFDLRLEKRLAIARERIARGLVDESDFEAAHLCRTSESLYEQLLASIPAGQEDLVFCHGDACLPNFIVFQGRLSGLIDMGRAGVSDRWQDLGIVLRSLAHNGYDDAHQGLFLEIYGEPLNEAKRDFYILLDEFF